MEKTYSYAQALIFDLLIFNFRLFCQERILDEAFERGKSTKAFQVLSLSLMMAKVRLWKGRWIQKFWRWIPFEKDDGFSN